MADTDTSTAFADASTERVTAENGTEYVFRDLGQARTTDRADDVADPPSAVRRSARLGDPGSLDARATDVNAFSTRQRGGRRDERRSRASDWATR
jgi:hypothetical protein